MAKKNSTKPAAAAKLTAAPKKAAPAAVKQPKPRKGGATAAAELLAKTGKPMKCLQMVEALAKSGAWTPKGKTPAATLASAIIREIKAKGGQSRFKKVAPGKFAAR